MKQGYYRELNQLLRHIVPPGSRVLDIGCGNGEMLHFLAPTYGVGIDISSRMIERANQAFGDAPNLRFLLSDACEGDVYKEIDEKFDIICVAGVIQEMNDVQKFLHNVRLCCTQETRLVIVAYSRLWQWPLKVAEWFGLKNPQPVENWIPQEFLNNLLYICDYDKIREIRHLVFPFPFGVVSRWMNRYIGHLPLIEIFSMLYCLITRPVGPLAGGRVRPSHPTCSVVIPCRNEAGHIPTLHKRLPDLPPGSEVIWVEGHSSDNTEEVLEQLVKENPDRPYQFLKQPGKGKADAVRFGFSKAKGDILLILDADITVSPEDMPKFIALLVSNKAEFVNGTRLIYPMDERAMRFLNLLGNKFFAIVFRRLLGQEVSDTLCGTKVMWREDYEKIIQNQTYFGSLDPFGDFDLLLGATRMHLKIVELAIRYGERSYGRTNISRFSHGFQLLRMLISYSQKVYFI